MAENTSGKTPKLAFIGFDGHTAEAVAVQENDIASPFYQIKQNGGGIYLSRTGGARFGEQSTVTGPGWTSLFTGTWAKTNGVKNNEATLKPEVRTIIFTLNALGISAQFFYSWQPHGDIIYKNEREAYPTAFVCAYNDAGTVKEVINAVNCNVDAVFCVLEHTDEAGHGYGYYLDKPEYVQAVESCKTDANAIINNIENRSTYDSEDWLIILTSDHGGIFKKHGGNTARESMVFIAADKKIF
ncbi:MAG: alkaline phosphatase family protein [Clostridiales bacterium]|nr:alkaline phosphatase family protein [Clostridiales bacterium]